MVDWKPIRGVIRPITQSRLASDVFKYQQFPEYQKTNFTMTLEQFKPIFMYEYLHRMLRTFYWHHFCSALFVLLFYQTHKAGS